MCQRGGNVCLYQVLEVIEVAPGIDLQRDVLDHMVVLLNPVLQIIAIIQKGIEFHNNARVLYCRQSA